MAEGQTQKWTERTARLMGDDAVERLAAASVAVFGLGGVGSYTAEALARAGVGRLVLVDGDTVSDTNRNRQLCALTSTVGQNKAAVTAARVRDINPACRVEVHGEFYLPAADGAPAVGPGWIDGCDYVADAIDMVGAKLQLAAECREKGIPLISAMGCGNKLDPTRFQVADIRDTRVCPLCRVMRRELKARGIEGLKVVYSAEPPRMPLGTDDRRTPASVSFVPGAAGLLMAGEIIKDLTGVR